MRVSVKIWFTNTHDFVVKVFRFRTERNENWEREKEKRRNNGSALGQS